MRPPLGVVAIEVPDLRHVHVLADDAAEVVPRFSQRRLDPGRVLVGERRPQVRLADPMGRQLGPEPPGRRAAEIRCAIRVGAAKQLGSAT